MRFKLFIIVHDKKMCLCRKKFIRKNSKLSYRFSFKNKLFGDQKLQIFMAILITKLKILNSKNS